MEQCCLCKKQLNEEEYKKKKALCSYSDYYACEKCYKEHMRSGDLIILTFVLFFSAYLLTLVFV